MPQALLDLDIAKLCKVQVIIILTLPISQLHHMRFRIILFQLLPKYIVIIKELSKVPQWQFQELFKNVQNLILVF